MGSGKSYWGRRVADALKFDFIDLDDYLETKANQTISNIFKEKGESYFRKLESKCLVEISELSNVVVALGGGTPCNEVNLETIKKTGLSFFINPSVQTIVSRLKAETAHRPLLHNKTAEELTGFINKKRKERMEYYLQSDYTIDNDNVIETVLNIL